MAPESGSLYYRAVSWESAAMVGSNPVRGVGSPGVEVCDFAITMCWIIAICRMKANVRGLMVLGCKLGVGLPLRGCVLW